MMTVQLDGFEAHRPLARLSGTVPPQVQFLSGVKFKISETALGLMGNPQWVQFWFNRDTHTLAIEPRDRRMKHEVVDGVTYFTYKVRDPSTGHGGEVNCSSIWKEYNIRRRMTAAVPASWNGQCLLVTLPEEMIDPTPTGVDTEHQPSETRTLG